MSPTGCQQGWESQVPSGADAHLLPATLPGGRPWPRISIVTPSLNQGQYLEETILSVTNQGYPEVEHIVIDGGSADQTQEILERYRDRLAYLVSEPDHGQAQAINKGFARASGDILTWLNSDDMLAPGALAAVALAFHYSGADLVAGICQLHCDGRPITQHLTGCLNGPLPLEDLLDLNCCWLTGQFFYQPEVMFTREIWERAGGRLDETWTYSMDYELWLRFAQHGARLQVIGRPVALFRVHPEQKTNLPEKFQAELIEVRHAFAQRTGLGSQRYQPPGRHKDRLRMVFFNDVGGLGGAGLAHGRLAEACAWAGHEVFRVAVAEKVTLGKADPPNAAAILDEIGECRPDLVVAGNMHGAGLDPEVLGAIAERWPTAFVMHDQWIVTGRCPYVGSCGKYVTGCDHTCPTAEEYPPLARSEIGAAWAAKRRVLGGARRPLLLANSRWTLDFVEQTHAARQAAGAMEDQRPLIEQIHLGFPLNVFVPRDRRICRELLDLPEDRFIIMTSACSVSDPRKGVAHLAAALEQLRLPDVLVVAVGHIKEGQMAPIRGLRAMGYLDRPEEMAWLYSAADLFVGPSLEEAFGQVFIEAAACGTPSVGYPVGGVPEAIAQGITGRVASAVHPAALAEAIEELYHDAELRRNMRVWARLHVENEWSLPAAYHRLFAALGRAGLRRQLGLAPKISLRPVRPTPRPIQYIQDVYRDWQAIRGFESEGSSAPGPQEVFPVSDVYPKALRQDGERMRTAFPISRPSRSITAADKNIRIAEALEALAAEGIRRVALYGAGRHTLEVIPALNRSSVDIGGIVDDAGPARLAGWPVVAPEDIDRLEVEAVVLSSDVHEQRMWEKRAFFESKGMRVIRLYEEAWESAAPAAVACTGEDPG